MEQNPFPHYLSCDPAAAFVSNHKMYNEFEDLGIVELATEEDNPSSSIRILQITDLHMFPRECRAFEGIPLLDSYDECIQLIATLVEVTKPDVIILTGDIIDGRGPWNSSDRVTETVQHIVVHFRGIPWAFLPGNHDDDHSPWTRAELTRIFQLQGCLQRKARGFHHTVLLTKRSRSSLDNKDSSRDVTRVRLHMFDSGGNHPNEKIMYYCTPAKAIDGFTRAVQKQAASAHDNDEADVTGLVYIHIPTPEYQGLDPVVGKNRLFEAAVMAGKLPPPLDKLVWLIKLLKKDRIAGCTRGQDTGLFSALVHANDHYNAGIASVFCGHDHHSDAVFYRRGIFLAYGRSGSLTPPYDWEGKAPNPLQPGARIAEVSSDGVLKTWIQTAIGAEHDSFLDMVSYHKNG